MCVCVNTHNGMILYEELISLPRLLQAWEAFRKDKTNKRDVQLFSLHLEDNLFALHTELKRQTYIAPKKPNVAFSLVYLVH